MLTDFLTLGEAGRRPYVRWKQTTTLYYPILDENPGMFLLSRAQQREMLLARNYTDIVFYADGRGNHWGFPGFSLWGDSSAFRARAQECIDDGLAVHCFLMQKHIFTSEDEHVAVTLAEVKAAWDTFVPAVDDLVTTWCPGLELNKTLSTDQIEELGAHLRTLTDKPIAAHSTPGKWLDLGPWQTDIWYQLKLGSGRRLEGILASLPQLLEKAADKGVTFTAMEYNHQDSEIVSMLIGKVLRELGVTSFGNGISEVEWAPLGEAIGSGEPVPVEPVGLAAILDAIASDDSLRVAIVDAICPEPEPPPPSGNVKDFPSGPHTSTLVIPADEEWILPTGLTQMEASLVVLGTLTNEPGAILEYVGINEAEFVGGGMDALPETDTGTWVDDAGRLNLADFEIRGTPEGRSHIWIQSTSPQRLVDGLIEWMGPQQDLDGDGDREGVAGRFPVHFHHAGDGSRGSLIERVTVRDSGNHAFWTHASSGIDLIDNTAERIQGEAYGWDRDHTLSNDILWLRNHAELVMPYEGDRGYHLGAFLLGQGTGNRCIDCSAANCLGRGENAGAVWPSSANNPPNTWEFRGFTVRGESMGGTRAWANTPSGHIVSDVIVEDAKFGIAHGAYVSSYQYSNYAIRRCDKGIILHAVSNRVQRPDGYGLTFENFETIEDVDTAIEVQRHVLTSDIPTLFKEIPILRAGQPVHIRHKVPSPKVAHEGLYDFVRVTVDGRELTSSDFNLEFVGLGSTFRVQRTDGGAWTMDHTGIVSDMQPFYEVT